MSRASTALIAFAAFALAGVPALASNYHYGFDTDAKDPVGWALVHEGHHGSSSLNGEDLEALEGKYGGDFLYIRDGDDRYVIRDPRLMRRAEDLMKPMEDAGREIGAAVGAKVSYSLDRSRGSRERASLERRIRRLSSRIERKSDEGEDTSDLAVELGELEHQLETMKQDRWERHGHEEREADLDAATERASRHMREATRRLNHDLLDILREAKSRHLAESVED